jgi:hypothetical protein
MPWVDSASGAGLGLIHPAQAETVAAAPSEATSKSSERFMEW